MSLLNFLRVLEGIQPWGGKESPPPRNRRLGLETLEGRAVLTLLGLPLPPPPEIQVPITAPNLELPPVPDLPSPDDGGSGSGTGEPGPGDPTADPPTDPAPTGSDSGSGSDPQPPPDDGGSGSGSGESNIPPEITLGSSQNSGMWVWFSGTVSDLDGPVQGLTVYFTIGLASSISFTATVQADGTYESMVMMLAAGTTISAYTIDGDGNHSTIVTCDV